jgi:hypothetical protein
MYASLVRHLAAAPSRLASGVVDGRARGTGRIDVDI